MILNLDTQTMSMTQGSVPAGYSPDKVVTNSWRSFNLWNSPDVYAMVLKAAHDGAQAILASPEGPFMRTVSNIMVRVDIVLGAVWEADGQISLWPMVNEMDWFNSAGMLSSFWVSDEPDALSEGNEESTSHGRTGTASAQQAGTCVDRDREAVMQSWGMKVAQALYEEVVRTYTEHAA